MSFIASAFLYIALAASGGALAFLAGQRASGRTPREVEDCYEQAALLEGVETDLRALEEEAAKAANVEEGREAVRNARIALSDAIRGLRRGADQVV